MYQRPLVLFKPQFLNRLHLLQEIAIIMLEMMPNGKEEPNKSMSALNRRSEMTMMPENVNIEKICVGKKNSRESIRGSNRFKRSRGLERPNRRRSRTIDGD